MSHSSPDESLSPRASRAPILNRVFIEHRGAIEAPSGRVFHGAVQRIFPVRVHLRESCQPIERMRRITGIHLSLSLSPHEIRRAHPARLPETAFELSRVAAIDSLLADARESRITRRHVREYERNGCLSRM